MNDTDMINEKLAEMKRRQAAQREAEMRMPRGGEVAQKIRALKEEAAKEKREQQTATQRRMEEQKKAELEVMVQEDAATACHDEQPQPRLSKFRGVCYFKPSCQWTANIKHNGKRYSNYCETEEGAAREYDRLAVKFKGASAVTNFPIEGYTQPEPEEEQVYVDCDIVISTARIRCAMREFLKRKPKSYRERNVNLAVFSDLFYGEETVPTDIIEICKACGIDPGRNRI